MKQQIGIHTLVIELPLFHKAGSTDPHRALQNATYGMAAWEHCCGTKVTNWAKGALL